MKLLKKILGPPLAKITPFLPRGFWPLYHRIINFCFLRIMFRKAIKNSEFRFRNSGFIVSLTSHGKRVRIKAPFAIASIFHQSVLPDRIILWLTHGTKIPYRLKKMQERGLEIMFCDDIQAYKKYLPALKEFPNAVITTADDDIYYHRDWFKVLKEAYHNDPTKIYCHSGQEVIFDDEKKVISIFNWRNKVLSTEHPLRVFPCGELGILYPPHVFKDEIFNMEKIQRLSPYCNDTWFWAMSHHSGITNAIAKNCIREQMNIGIDNDGFRMGNYTEHWTDKAIQNVLKEYPEILKRLMWK